MEFFDKLGEKASKAYKITADKTGKIAKETKIKIKINNLKNEVNDLYKEIGKKIYEKHILQEEILIKKDLEEQLAKIDMLSDEIEVLLKECLELKDKKECSNCYKQIEKEFKFCHNCGEKQEDVEKEDSTSEEDIQIENQIIMEEIEIEKEIEEQEEN